VIGLDQRNLSLRPKHRDRVHNPIVAARPQVWLFPGQNPINPVRTAAETLTTIAADPRHVTEEVAGDESDRRVIIALGNPVNPANFGVPPWL
jgi:hypothetical protein